MPVKRPATPAPATSRPSRRQMLAGCLALAGSKFAAAASGAEDARPAGDAEPEVQGKLYQSIEGPWGALQYYHFYLEAPEHLIRHIPPPSTQTRWTIPQSEAPRIEELLKRAGLADSTRGAILDPRRLVVNAGLYSMFPDPQLVLRLPREARSLIYNYLGQFPQNPQHSAPLYIFSGSVDEWAEDTDIRPELIEAMKELTYQRGTIMAMSDAPLILGMAKTNAEARALIKRFTRVRSMIARLEIPRDVSPAKITDYWSTGLGLRRKDVEPLIRSVAKTPGVAQLDILHLLPPLPRKLLYTYPDIDMAMEGRFPDCHWTSLNFFSYSPQAFYLNERLATTAIQERFEKVEPPYQFGDILIFMTSNSEAHHSCTYLAADMVFTKNGRNILIPWTMAHLGDVKGLYSEVDGKPLHVVAWRPRPEDAA